MSKFTDFLASLTGRPKNFDAATATLTDAKTHLDSVTALFANAGLQVETLLAGGPDALKLHIAGLDNTAEVTRLTSELATATTDLATTKTTLGVRDSTLSAFAEAFTAIGLADITNKTPAADVKSKFAAHVEKQTTLKLANSGHPPKHVPAAVDTTAPTTDAQFHAEWKAMKPSAERLAFFSKNEASITRHERNA